MLKQERHRVSEGGLYFMIIMVVLFSGSNKAFADDYENPLNFKQVDEISYRLYTEQKWDSLIDFGKAALAADIDYFYLRVRLGLAYFNLENYFLSAHHLEKALHFNATDKTAQEYLYFAYKNSNRAEDANRLFGKLPENLKKTIDPDRKHLGEIVLEAGPIFSDNIEKNTMKIQKNGNVEYAEQDLYDDALYWQAGAGFSLTPWISLYLGYNNLRISKLKQIETTELVKTGEDVIVIGPGILPHNIYKNQKVLTENNYTLNQDGLYVNANLVLGNGFSIIPAYQRLIINYTTIYADQNQEQYLAQVYDTIPSVKAVYQINESNQHIENSIIALGINKTCKNFTFGLEGTWSDLNFKHQYQVSATTWWYPEGNLNYYFGTGLTYASEERNGNLVYNQLAGIRVLPKLWAEGFVTVGQMLNYNENNAYVVYNSNDVTIFRAGANILIPVSTQIEFSLRYRYLQNETNRYVVNSNDMENIQKLVYHNHTLIGGIQWNF